MKKLIIVDEREQFEQQGKTYREEEAVTMCKEFLELVGAFCDKYHTALIGQLLFTQQENTTGTLFIMQGLVPERDEIDRALATMLTEVSQFYDLHEDAK